MGRAYTLVELRIVPWKIPWVEKGSHQTARWALFVAEKRKSERREEGKKKRAVKVSPTIEFDEEMEPVGLSPQFILGQQRCRLFGHGRSAVKTRQIVGLTESTWKLDEGLTA